MDPVNLYASFGQLIRFGVDEDLESVERCWRTAPYLGRFISSWFIRGDSHAQFAIKKAINVVEFFERRNLDRASAMFIIGGQDLAVDAPHVLTYLKNHCPQAKVVYMHEWKHGGITRPWASGPVNQQIVNFICADEDEAKPEPML